MVRGKLKKGETYFLMLEGETSYTEVELVKWNGPIATILRDVNRTHKDTAPIFMLESKAYDASDRAILTQYIDKGDIRGDINTRRTTIARLRKKFPEYFI